MRRDVAVPVVASTLAGARIGAYSTSADIVSFRRPQSTPRRRFPLEAYPRANNSHFQLASKLFRQGAHRRVRLAYYSLPTKAVGTVVVQRRTG